MRKTPAPKVTTREKLLIVTEAIRLIKKHWITSRWKLFLGYDPKTKKPIFGFCVDGAIAQATLNKLGAARAQVLGAINCYADVADVTPDRTETYELAETGEVCELLSVQKLARQVLKEEGWTDDRIDDEFPQVQVNDVLGFKPTLKLLRRKQRELRAHVKKLDARKAEAKS